MGSRLARREQERIKLMDEEQTVNAYHAKAQASGPAQMFPYSRVHMLFLSICEWCAHRLNDLHYLWENGKVAWVRKAGARLGPNLRRPLAR